MLSLAGRACLALSLCASVSIGSVQASGPAAATAQAGWRGQGVPIHLESMRYVHYTSLGGVLSDRYVKLGAPAPAPDLPAQRNECPVTSTHTDANFQGGSYIVQAGFGQNESAGATYTLNSADFPIKIKTLEMIFATSNAAVQTVTEWSVQVWAGVPTNGQLVAEYSSDGVLLPHARIGPGTAGLNIQFSIDPNDPQQIIVNNFNNTNQFTIVYRIDRHNNQTQDPCLVGPPTASNAFPVTDVSGLAQPSGNWLRGLNCGPFGCPPNGGWVRFNGLNILCRPSGDWVMRSTWTRVNCAAGPGACCVNNACIILGQADCAAISGTFAGAGTTCADSNGNGRPDACEPRNCPADCDANSTIDVNDFFCYLARYANNDQRADIDGTPGIDINDFFFYLRIYSTGCP